MNCYEKCSKNNKNANQMIHAVPFILMLLALQLPSFMVQSLSIQSQTLVPSPLSTIKVSPATYISSTCPYNTISKRRAVSRFRPTSFSHLYTSSDDSLGSSPSTSNTTKSPDHNSATLSSRKDKDVQTVSTESFGNGGLLPSYKQLIVFTATTILIWLSEPLLSLVDTTIVGLTASAKSAVVQIAALGPATTLFDSLIYTTYFLAISTTNQLAPGLAAAASTMKTMSNKTSDKKSKNATNPWRELRQSTSHLLGLAIIFGSIVSAITFSFGRPIIGQMVGGATNMGAAEANAIIPLAANYARIRAMVAPFSILGFVAQSFCLTTLDIATPAIAVAAASIVNIIGDLILSPRYGIQGAAIATALATVTSCSILLRKVRKTTSEWKLKQLELEQFTATVEETTSTKTEAPSMPSSTGMSQLDGTETQTKNEALENFRDIPFWSIPDKSSLIDLFKLAGPIFFVMMAKVACYNVMTIRATSFGIVPLASHNIMMRVYFFFACFGDSLSQAAQSFYPQVDKKARGKLIRRLFCIASVIGLFNNGVSRLILSKFGRFLTKDLNIMKTMAAHSPWVGLAELLHPFIMLLEGTVLARRDLVFMVGTYILTSLLHFGFIFSPVSSTFAGLWRALFGFQLIRFVQFSIRVLQQSRVTRQSKSSVQPADGDGIPAPPL